jgi:hypothetical protein
VRKYSRPLAGILILVVLLGCRSLSGTFATPTPPPEPTNPVPLATPALSIPVLNGDWHINLNKSGGIMGLSRSLEILSSGEMNLSDLRIRKTSQTRLPADRLSELTGLVANSHYQPVSVPTGCADCFIYNLEISSGGQTFQVQLNQIDLTNSGLQPLVDFLGQYMNAVIK